MNSAVSKFVTIVGIESPNLILNKSDTFFVFAGFPPRINLDWLIKSNFADLSVKNSGLKTNVMFLYLFWKPLVVPGVIVT